MTCAGNDFLQRVAGDANVGIRGRMVCGDGTAPVSGQSSGSSAIERAISSLAPEQYSEDDIEQLVQTITDQIMAAAN